MYLAALVEGDTSPVALVAPSVLAAETEDIVVQTDNPCSAVAIAQALAAVAEMIALAIAADIAVTS